MPTVRAIKTIVKTHTNTSLNCTDKPIAWCKCSTRFNFLNKVPLYTLPVVGDKWLKICIIHETYKLKTLGGIEEVQRHSAW